MIAARALKTLLVGIAFGISGGFSLAAAAAMNLSTKPIFLGNTTTPNVFFELDDSGSMDWEILTKQHFHYLNYWNYYSGGLNQDHGLLVHFMSGASTNYCNQSTATETANGWWPQRSYAYMYSNSDNAYTVTDHTCADADGNSEEIDIERNPESTVRDWRIRSSDFNVLYYDADVTYEPWPGMSDASFIAVRSDPDTGSTGYSLTKDLAGFVYEVWEDTRGYITDTQTITLPRGPGQANVAINISDRDYPFGPGSMTNSAGDNGEGDPAVEANGAVDVWDKHTRYTVNADSVTIEVFTYDRDDITAALVQRADGSWIWGCDLTNAQEDPPYASCMGASKSAPQTITGAAASAALGGKTVAEVQQNIANWYQYARRRSFVAKGAVSNVMSNAPNFRYGLSVINESDTLFVEVPTETVPDYVAHNNSLRDDLYSFDWPARGTPLRKGLQSAGMYFDGQLSGKTDPIIDECQQNFTVLMTDGYWNGDPPTTVGDADEDGAQVVLDDDTIDNATVADVAMHYYETDLSSFDDTVPTTDFDTNSQQHMVTFGVAFGVEGQLVDTDADGWPEDPNNTANPLPENGDWGNPLACVRCSDPEKIDDLWHAAYNSRGAYIAAQRPADVVTGLGEVLADIAARVGSGTSAAANSGSLSTNNKLYTASFDSSDWSGALRAVPLSDGSDYPSGTGCNAKPRGDLCDETWNAATLLESNTSREILTYKPSSGLGIPFQWPTDTGNLQTTELDASQVTELDSNDSQGEARLEYLRGARTNEGTGNNYRVRTSVLGDIVHSDPVYVGKPLFPFSDDMESASYETFRSNHASRTGMIYMGANDGMLHAFDAETGAEKFAYVPAELFPKLRKLTFSAYDHLYFVDGPINVMDAFFDDDRSGTSDSAWHTVLTGSLRGGGQGIFALDVTDPDNVNETNAASSVLWEFTNDDDADLGYTYGRVSVVKTQTGKWAAVFGNGYNNTESDGAASTTGHAVIYVAYLDGGLDGIWTLNTDYFKLDTKNGTATDPNGAAAPTVVDLDGDFVADYIYAGDLSGNVWKIDITDSDASNWDFSFKDGSDDPLPLFQATRSSVDQPVTHRIIVGGHPLDKGTGSGANGVMLYFGTGKYLEPSDNVVSNSEPVQTIYGIWDPNDGNRAGTRTDLQQQTILREIDFATTSACTSSTDKCVRITSDNEPTWSGTGAQGGWYLDLVYPSGQPDGERVIHEPLLRSGRLVISTFVPSSNPCDDGGSGWVFDIDATTGSRRDTSPFDLNDDLVFTGKDLILIDLDGDGTDEQVAASGRHAQDSVPNKPKVLIDVDGTVEHHYTSDSSNETSHTYSDTGVPLGRQSWRQVR